MTAALLDNSDREAPNAFPTGRIPAWKILGLKLKFANEHADQPLHLDSKSLTDKKRPRAETPQETAKASSPERKVKKRPRLNSPEAPTALSIGTDLKALSPSLKRESNGTRKTVSFSSDTKVEDGDSSRSLIADWEAQYDQQTKSSKDSKSTKKKKVVKAKKPKLSSTAKKPHAALEYLTRFSQSKDTWKFNKNKEIWILKHLFSLDAIPSEYNLALNQYLQGLKAGAARSRIQQEAREIVRKDQEQQIGSIISAESEDSSRKREKLKADMEDPERRKAYYEESVRRYKRKLETHLDEVAEEELHWVSPERLAKRRRAEITLWSLGVTPSTEEVTQSSDTTSSSRSMFRQGTYSTENTPQFNNAQKKRKNRTSVVELSSSSEEASGSDSGSSSSDCEDGEHSTAGTRTTGTTSETSSSGSSNSSRSSSADSHTGSESSSDDDSKAEEENKTRKAVVRTPSRRQPSVISVSS